MRHDDGSRAKPLVESDDGLAYVGLSDDHAVVDSGERGDVFGDWLVWVNQLLVSVYEFSVMDFHGSDFDEFSPVFGFEAGGFGYPRPRNRRVVFSLGRFFWGLDFGICPSSWCGLLG